MFNLNEHSQHVKDTYDNGLFLGRLVWYSITEDTKVDYATFCAEVLTVYSTFDGSIPPNLPPAPRYVDVFKRGCTQAKLVNVPAPVVTPVVSCGGVGFPQPKPYTKSNYTVRPAGADPSKVWRMIVREDLDTENHSLGYTELCSIQFNRTDNSINFTPLAAYADDAKVDGMKREIADYYTKETSNLTAYFVREYIRGLLEKNMYAIRVRPSGGVYFIHEQYAPVVDALEIAITNLGEKFGSSMHSLPLLDDSKQREMLRAAFENESVGEVDQLLGEVSAILKDDKQISMNKYQQFAEVQDALVKKVADYSDLLDQALDLTGSRLELLRDVMWNLASQVKVD